MYTVTYYQIFVLSEKTNYTYRILSCGGKEDGSRMIVPCEMHVCLLRGLGHEFTSSQIAIYSDAIWDEIFQTTF